MNDDIMFLSNKLVYQDKLKSGSADVAAQRLTLPKPEALADAAQWLKGLLDPM